MQPISTAPRDRGILLHFNDGRSERPYERFAVAHYAQWDGGVGHYGEVWETGPGECYTLGSPEIVGWSELPRGSACEPTNPHLILVRVYGTGENGTEPVHMVLGMGIDPGDDESAAFWIDENTCPWNVLRFPIACGTDTDPHGVLQYVAKAPCPPEWLADGDVDMGEVGDSWEGWCKVFPVLLETKEPRDD